MATNPSAAETAAQTFLFIERASPGGAGTTAGRIRHDAVTAVAILMAAALPASAGFEERRAFLNQLDTEGSEHLRPVNMSAPDLRKMSPSERLDYIHKRSALHKGAGK